MLPKECRQTMSHYHLHQHSAERRQVCVFNVGMEFAGSVCDATDVAGCQREKREDEKI